jgi:hypothetical protein
LSVGLVLSQPLPEWDPSTTNSIHFKLHHDAPTTPKTLSSIWESLRILW